MTFTALVLLSCYHLFLKTLQELKNSEKKQVALNFFAAWQEKCSQFALSKRKLFLSEYRALMMIGTCVAILAVDFTIFPRRLAKTEVFGYSLVRTTFLLQNLFNNHIFYNKLF